MELTYTYWEGESGWLVGCLNDYPEQWTQGKDIKELEEMLLDLYDNFQVEQVPRHPDVDEILARNIIKHFS